MTTNKYKNEPKPYEQLQEPTLIDALLLKFLMAFMMLMSFQNTHRHLFHKEEDELDATHKNPLDQLSFQIVKLIDYQAEREKKSQKESVVSMEFEERVYDCKKRVEQQMVLMFASLIINFIIFLIIYNYITMGEQVLQI